MAFTYKDLLKCKEAIDKAEAEWSKNPKPLMITESLLENAKHMEIDVDLIAKQWGYDGYKVYEKI